MALVIQQGIELRNEQKITLVTLRDYCETLFQGKPVPTKPALPTLFELVYQNVMARRIQQCWFLFNYAKKHKQEMENEEASMQLMNQLANSANEDFGQAELMYFSHGRTEVVGGQVAEIDNMAVVNLEEEADLTQFQSSEQDENQALQRTISQGKEQKKQKRQDNHQKQEVDYLRYILCSCSC